MPAPVSNPQRVAVTLIRSGQKLLLVYNSKWRAFTFPMTKLREWDHSDSKDTGLSAELEQAFWADAAAHAAVECLGRSNSPTPVLDGVLPMELTEVERSRRDGADRTYHYKIFELNVGEQVPSLVQPAEWLTPQQLRDGRRPISPTALQILGHQEVGRIVGGWS